MSSEVFKYFVSETGEIIMKVAVVAANGKAGKLIVKEAAERGHDVVAFARGENKTVASNYVSKDILEITAEDLKGFDVVIDAFGVRSEEALPLHSTTLKHLADVLSGSSTRLLVVGGAGSLYLDDTHTVTVSETDDFPAEYLPVVNAMKKGLSELRLRDDVKWTYVSPAGDFVADGEKTGEYLQAGEVFTLNENNESRISYADYAVAMLDIAESGKYVRERISVLGK